MANKPLPQAELIDGAIKDPTFPMDAAQEALKVRPILTVHTTSWKEPYYKGEIDMSYHVYEAEYSRSGMLRALAERGVVHIPASRRQVVNEAFASNEDHTVSNPLGVSIVKLFRSIREIRRRG